MGEFPLVDLAQLIDPDRAISYGIVQPGSPCADGVPIIRVSDVRNSQISTSNPLRVLHDIEAQYSRTRLRGGELLITIVGTVGETAIVPQSLAGWNVARAIAVLPVRSDVGAYWVQLALQSPLVRSRIDSRLNTTVQATLNLGDVAKLPILLPPKPERERIEALVGALDRKIELNRRMNETLEAMARAIFKDWFVDFGPTRAKMEGRTPYLAPEIWALFPDRRDNEGKPEGWNFAKLGDLCARVAIGPFGSDITTDNFVDHGVPIVRGGNLKNGFIDDNFVYVTDAKADALRNANAFAEDIVITHRGTLGQVGIIPKRPIYARYVVSQSQMLLTANSKRATPRFIFEFLRSGRGAQQLLAFTSQVGVPAIARPTTSLKSLNVVVPSRPILLAFDNLLAPLVEREGANISEIRTLAATRDLLLPKVMSGELRVKDAENVAVAEAAA
jgi:type I restriction enzyme, S subunit